MDDFSIQHTRNGNVTVVTISGRVDSVTAATLDDELLEDCGREQEARARSQACGVFIVCRCARHHQGSPERAKIGGRSQAGSDSRHGHRSFGKCWSDASSQVVSIC